MFDFTFDEPAVLKQLKLDTSSAEMQEQVIARLYDALDRRVTVQLQAQMTDDDVERFNAAHQQGIEQARAWLQRRFPNAHEVYQAELESLVSSLRESADNAVDTLTQQ